MIFVKKISKNHNNNSDKRKDLLRGSAVTVKTKKTQINNKAFNCMILKFLSGVRFILNLLSLLLFSKYLYKKASVKRSKWGFNGIFFATLFTCTTNK